MNICMRIYIGAADVRLTEANIAFYLAVLSKMFYYRLPFQKYIIHIHYTGLWFSSLHSFVHLGQFQPNLTSTANTEKSVSVSLVSTDYKMSVRPLES